MDKKKYTMAVHVAAYKEYELENGDKILVSSFIPYKEKERFIMDLQAFTLQTDEEQGICYRGYNYQAAHMYCFLKYYTDVDVEDVDIEEVFDWITSNGDMNELYEQAYGDMSILDDMELDIFDACKKRYIQEHSLGQMAKVLLNADIDANNAETRELIEKLTDMQGALLEKEENEKILQFGQKKAVKSVKTGGAKINLAKKN